VAVETRHCCKAASTLPATQTVHRVNWLNYRTKISKINEVINIKKDFYARN